MMRYLTYRRFNFIDATAIACAFSFLSDGQYTSWVLMMVGGALLSVCLEIKAREDG